MRKIAYIEIDTHAEVALSFYKLMRDSGVFKVDFYFSSRIKNLIDIDDEKINIINKNTLFNQLSKTEYDLVIIGTMHRYFNVFSQVTKHYNTALINHNLNFGKASSFKILKSIFKNDFKYRLKLLLKEGLLQKNKVYDQISNHLVLEKSFVNYQKGFVYFPIFYNEFIETKKTDKDLVVVIPGAVSQQRRDYWHVLKQLKGLSNLKLKIEIIFLGKAQNEELQEIITTEKKLDPNLKIIYFTEKVQQNIFDSWMQNANFIWCPIKQKTQFFSQEEIYGKTKMSGNIGDAIKYGKIAVFPSFYQSDNHFVVKEDNDLLNQFKEIENLNFDFLKRYNKGLVQTELENVIKILLK